MIDSPEAIIKLHVSDYERFAENSGFYASYFAEGKIFTYFDKNSWATYSRKRSYYDNPPKCQQFSEFGKIFALVRKFWERTVEIEES